MLGCPQIESNLVSAQFCLTGNRFIDVERRYLNFVFTDERSNSADHLTSPRSVADDARRC